MPHQTTWAENQLIGSISERYKLSLLKELCGWEAGIRTPIPWSRDPFTHFGALRSASFQAVFHAKASVCFGPVRYARVQRVSLCLT